MLPTHPLPSPAIPKWYQAYFWTGTGAGAWHAETMWHLPQTGDIAVDLYLPLPSPNNLRGYTAGQPVFMNVSVSDTKDGDFPVRTHTLNPCPFHPSPAYLCLCLCVCITRLLLRLTLAWLCLCHGLA